MADFTIFQNPVTIEKLHIRKYKNFKVQASGKATVTLSFMVYPHLRSSGIQSSDGMMAHGRVKT